MNPARREKVRRPSVDGEHLAMHRRQVQIGLCLPRGLAVVAEALAVQVRCELKAVDEPPRTVEQVLLEGAGQLQRENGAVPMLVWAEIPLHAEGLREAAPHAEAKVDRFPLPHLHHHLVTRQGALLQQVFGRPGQSPRVRREHGEHRGHPRVQFFHHSAVIQATHALQGVNEGRADVVRVHKRLVARGRDCSLEEVLEHSPRRRIVSGKPRPDEFRRRD
mmetsp:Transcript_97030/g.274175  ORF Transcript_97030/g.274175 Transcript_97030/m.274175 type:complete len:219 (+) Transcript_97030:597-1253(+)